MEKDKKCKSEEYQEENINIELTEKQKKFCREYILDWNGARAYEVTYPDCKSYDSIRAAASRLLTNVNIKTYISEIQKDLEKVAGISRLMVVEELKKLAFSNISKLHNTWIERKEFELLTDSEKACIESIETRTSQINDGDDIKTIEFVKIKLYDKQRAIDSISKMLGYNEPDKLTIDATMTGDPFKKIKENSGIDETDK